MSPLAAARHLAAPGDRLLPLSDGGDGFLECLHHALGGAIEEVAAADPFGRVRPVPVLRLSGGGVAVECAKVIGLAGLDRLDPVNASSRGLGELLQRFQDQPRVWIGLGGSATVDGGRDWPELASAADDGVLRRADRPRGRGAHLRAPEGGTARRRPDAGGASRRSRSSARAAHGRRGRPRREAPVAGGRPGRRRRTHARCPRLRRRLSRCRRRRHGRGPPRRLVAGREAARRRRPPRACPRVARGRPLRSSRRRLGARRRALRRGEVRID